MGLGQVLSGDIIDSLYANVTLNASNPTAGLNDILPTTLTGFVAGPGTVAATDTILQAFQKLAGNLATGYVPYTGATSDVNLGVFNLITPKVTGGSAVGSTLTLQGTSGNGTSTVAAIIGNVGNNGATNAFNVYNSGQFNIGNYASPTNLRIFTVGQDTAYMSFGSVVGATSYSAIYFNQATPSGTNYTLAGDGGSTFLNASTYLYLRIGASNRVTITDSAQSFTPNVASSGAITNFTFTGSSNTGQTASTEINRMLITTGSRQWATGAITTQREVYITSPTYSFVGASTITNAYSLYVAKPTAGSNATITKNIGIGTDGMVEGQGFRTTGYRQDIITAQDGTGLLENQFVANGGVSLASMSNSSAVGFKVGGTGGTEVFRASGINSSGAINNFIFSATSNTGQTASTEINGFLYNSYTRTWAAGAITTQREQYIKTVTYAFASASTITTAYGLYVESPTAGSNATITNNYSIGTSGNIAVGGGGLYFPSGSGSIYTPNGQFSLVQYGNTRYLFGINAATFTPAATTSGANSTLTLNNPAHTGQNASTEIPGFKYVGGSRQWNAGAITTQRESYFSSTTYSFVSASTISNAYGLYVEAPTAGTNATIVNNYGFGTNGPISCTGTYGFVIGGIAATNRIQYYSGNYFQFLNSGDSYAEVRTGALMVNGGLTINYVAKTANYAIQSADVTIDCTANSFTVTLPTAVGTTGKVYNIINSGAGTITVATTSSQTIGNISPATTATINPGEVLNVQSDGTNWKLYA